MGKSVKNRKKKKLNKYAVRRIMAIIFIIILIFAIKGIVSLFKGKEKKPDLSILLNNQFLSTQKEVIIDEGQNIYFSKDDIQLIFDEMIYYNDAEKELITTYNTHTALLKIDEANMLINDQNVPLTGRLQDIDGIVYVPLKDLQTVYDIEIQYLEENNRIIIDSLLKEKKQASLAKNAKIKEKKGMFKDTIDEILAGETVVVLETDKNYKKVRTSLGNIGYVKANKLINEVTLREDVKKEVFDLKIYEEYSNISGIYEDITVDENKLNLVTPTFFYIGKNSKLLDKTASSTATYANYTNWLKENELEILPTLESTECVCSTLLTYSQRSQIINGLCEKIVKYQYKGINIDIDEVDDINSLYRLIIELAPRFKELDLILCVTLNDQTEKEKILKITDYIIEE